MSSFRYTQPPQYSRSLNRHLILDLIRFAPGGVSRSQLAKEVGITRAAVTSIIKDLLDSHTVKEVERKASRVGRHPVVLEIDPQQGYVAGIDIGVTHCLVILADFSASVIKEEEIAISLSNGPEQCLFEVDQLLESILEMCKVPLEQIRAIGVDVPGPVITGQGMVSSPPIMPGWDGYPIQDHLEELWGCPVLLGNDAEMGALGEWAYGAGRGESNLIYIKVGSGVGAGLLIDGKIYRGTTGCAGEIGHITIEENGELCSCGNHGCLETLAGGKAIAQQAIRAIHNGQRTQLSRIIPAEKITAMDVLAAARSGDMVAQDIVHRAGAHLGTAISSLVNLFNPSIVVVGGGVSQSGDLLLEPVRQTVRKRSLKAVSHSLRISSAVMGRRSSAMGCIVQALSYALHQPVSHQKTEVKEKQNHNSN
jgi:glucokinase-like ROK family protein